MFYKFINKNKLEKRRSLSYDYLTGQGAPSKLNLGKPGDLYLDLVSGILYEKDKNV